MSEKELIAYIIRNIKDIIADKDIIEETLTFEQIDVLNLYKNKIILSFLNYFNGKSSFYIDINVEYNDIELYKTIFKCIDMIIDNIDLIVLEELNKLLKGKRDLDLNLNYNYENLFLNIIKIDLNNDIKKNLLLLLTDDEKAWEIQNIQIKDKEEYDKIISKIDEKNSSNILAKRLKSRITIFNSTNIIKTLNDPKGKNYYYYDNYSNLIKYHKDPNYPNLYLLFFKHFYYGYDFDNFCNDINNDVDMLNQINKSLIILYLYDMVTDFYNDNIKSRNLVKKFEKPLEEFCYKEFGKDITDIIFNNKEIKDEDLNKTLSNVYDTLINFLNNNYNIN